MQRLFWIPLFLLCTALVAAEPRAVLLKDPFTEATFAGRRPLRGPWQIADGVARCTQDDELYKQHNDHGPIIFYDADFHDGVIRFAYRPEGCRTFVFTANGEQGHVFRFVSNERGTSLRAFPPGGEKKAIQLGEPGPALKPGQWTEVTVELRGPRATVSIGDDYASTVEHASLTRPKTNVSVGFSFGTIAVKEFSIAP